MTSNPPRVWAWSDPAQEEWMNHRKTRTGDPFRPTSEAARNLIPHILAPCRPGGPSCLSDAFHSANDALPKIGEQVIVTTRGFRCLGYLDETGTWRHASDQAPIDQVLHWTRGRRS